METNEIMGLIQDSEPVKEPVSNVMETAHTVMAEAQKVIAENQHLVNNQPDMIFWLLLTIFVLACFVGYYVVWRVTPALQSPLMSVSNAISGIVIVGALLTAGAAAFSFSKVFGILAVFFASINIFGGFVVSQRMLAMFKKKSK